MKFKISRVEECHAKMDNFSQKPALKRKIVSAARGGGGGGGGRGGAGGRERHIKCRGTKNDLLGSTQALRHRRQTLL